MDAADLQEFSSRAATVGAAIWPAIVLIGDGEYPATVPEPRMLGNLISGGETAEGSLVARISLEVLPQAPSENQALRWKRPGESSYRARAWWIESVRRSPIDSEWVIQCVVKN